MWPGRCAQSASARVVLPVPWVPEMPILIVGLDAGGAVDAFPDQVGVAVVAGVLLDQVDVNPAEADVLPHEAAGVGQGAGGAEVAGAGDLLVPGGAGGIEGGVLGQVEAAVGAVRIGLGVVDGRGVLSRQHPAEPVPLDL